MTCKRKLADNVWGIFAMTGSKWCFLEEGEGCLQQQGAGLSSTVRLRSYVSGLSAILEHAGVGEEEGGMGEGKEEREATKTVGHFSGGGEPRGEGRGSAERADTRNQGRSRDDSEICGRCAAGLGIPGDAWLLRAGRDSHHNTVAVQARKPCRAGGRAIALPSPPKRHHPIPHHHSHWLHSLHHRRNRPPHRRHLPRPRHRLRRCHDCRPHHLHGTLPSSINHSVLPFSLTTFPLARSADALLRSRAQVYRRAVR